MKDLRDLARAAAVTDEELQTRDAEVDLLPGEDDCPVWMEWTEKPGSSVTTVARKLLGGKRQRRKAKGGDEEFERAYVQALAKLCCRKIHGVTMGGIRDYGLMGLSSGKWFAMLSELTGSPVEELQSLDDDALDTIASEEIEIDPEWFTKVSKVFYLRVQALQDAATVQEAEDSLRKKRLAATSSTGA